MNSRNVRAGNNCADGLECNDGCAYAEYSVQVAEECPQA